MKPNWLQDNQGAENGRAAEVATFSGLGETDKSGSRERARGLYTGHI